jgi:hypothetical protein
MTALAQDLPGPPSVCPEHGFVHGTLGPASRGPDCNWSGVITDRLTTEPEPPHRLSPEEFGEDFDVYRSGAATTLLCLRCQASRSIVGRIRLTALVDEAASHADTCPRRP